MECLYHATLSHSDTKIMLESAEAKHSKALRLKPGGQVLITDGRGLTALCRVAGEVTAPHYLPEEFYELYNELPVRHTAVIGIIENKDRLEFCVEKLTELGIAEIALVFCERSGKTKIDTERLERKAFAAMKQSKRSVFPLIAVRNSLEEAFENIVYERLVTGDEEGASSLPTGISTVIAVGPEGGFTQSEMNFLEQLKTAKLRVGRARLRTETAAIAIMARLV